MQKSFLSEIKEIPHTYTKINFDTSKIKNIDNIYEAYEIPRSEKIVAFIKSSIILAPLSLGGNIITDCAIYHHPSHDDWAEVNRVPFSELCRYVILQKNDMAEVVMVNSEEARIMRGDTVFGINKAGIELIDFMKKMQSILIRKYTWAKEQNDNEYYEIVLVSAQEIKCGDLPEELDAALNELQKNKRLKKKIIFLRAEEKFRMSNQAEFKTFVSNIEDTAIRHMVENNIQIYIKSFISDLSNVEVEMNLEYLQKVHDNILNQNALSKDYNLILAYINIRLRNDEMYEDNILKDFDIGTRRNLDFFKGKYYNAQMKLVYEDIEEGITPPEECWDWTDSIGLTPLHYAIILNQTDVIVDFLRDKLWTISDDTDRLYDYSTVAFYLSVSYRQDICLLTTETLIKKKKYVDELKKECEDKRNQAKSIVDYTNKLQRELRIAYEERDYGSVQNLRVNIETLTEQSKNLREEINDLQIEYNELEFEIKEELNDKINSVDLYIRELEKSDDEFVSLILAVFKNNELLYHILSDSTNDVLLYIYQSFLFVVPNDIRLNLMYYDNPFGEVKKNKQTKSEYKYSKRNTKSNSNNTNRYTCTLNVDRPYGSSWFSPQAHSDENILNAEYRKLAKQYHPDLCKQINAKEIFQEITNEKNNILNNIG